MLSEPEPVTFWARPIYTPVAWISLIAAILAGGGYSTYVFLKFAGRLAQPPPLVSQSRSTQPFGRPVYHSKQALLDEGRSLRAQGRLLEALKKFEDAASSGSAQGSYEAGLLYLEGKDLPKQPEVAAKAFIKALEAKAAERGYQQPLPEALWKLAWLYEQGQGVPRDLEFSHHLRERVLGMRPYPELSQESAEFLAHLWEEGKGGRRDWARAADFYAHAGQEEKVVLMMIQAAAQNDPEGVIRLGRAYLLGEDGFEKDPAKGEELLQRQGELGEGRAWMALYRYFSDNEGEGKDPVKAKECLRKAAEAKNPDLLALRGWGRTLIMASPPVRAEEGFAFLRQAYEENFGENFVEGVEGVQGELAWAYARGVGTSRDLLAAARLHTEWQDFSQARRPLLKAIKEKQPGALVALGEMYLAKYRSSKERSALSAAKSAFQEGMKTGEATADVHLGRLLAGLEGGQAEGGFSAEAATGVALLMRAAEAGHFGAASSAFLALKRHKVLTLERSRILADRLRFEADRDPVSKLALVVLLFEGGDPDGLIEAMKRADELAHGAAVNLEAADKGLLHDLMKVGALSLDGKGELQDPVRARRLFRLGVALDLLEAWAGLARIYGEGRGVQGDPIREAYCQLFVRFPPPFVRGRNPRRSLTP